MAVDIATAWISWIFHPSPLLDGTIGGETGNSGGAQTRVTRSVSAPYVGTLPYPFQTPTYILFTTSITLHPQCSSTSSYQLTDCYCLLTSVTSLHVILALQSHNLYSYFFLPFTYLNLDEWSPPFSSDFCRHNSLSSQPSHQLTTTLL